MEYQIRAGNKWLDIEDALLVLEIGEKKSYEEIAKRHKRTIIGIVSRVITKIIYPKLKEDYNIDEISAEYKIDKSLLRKFINKLNNIDNKDNKILKKFFTKMRGITKKPKLNNDDDNDKMNIILHKLELLSNKLDIIRDIIVDN
jgi:hypothetical protein